MLPEGVRETFSAAKTPYFCGVVDSTLFYRFIGEKCSGSFCLIFYSATPNWPFCGSSIQ